MPLMKPPLSQQYFSAYPDCFVRFSVIYLHIVRYPRYFTSFPCWKQLCIRMDGDT